jgi:hypothetical protein
VILAVSGVELMEIESAHHAGENPADSNLVSSGLRNRMETSGNNYVESIHVQEEASSTPNKPDASLALLSSVQASSEDHPDLSGERGCFMLLITLYALQGGLLGLASGTLPFIIQVQCLGPLIFGCV